MSGPLALWDIGFHLLLDLTLKVQVGGTTVDVEGNRDTDEDMALGAMIQTQTVF